MTRKSYKVPIYPARLIIHDSVKAAITEVGRKGYGPEQCVMEQMTGACTITMEDIGTVVMGFDADHSSADVAAHEALHAGWDILHMAGVQVTRDNHEALAYLVSWIMRKIEVVLSADNTPHASQRCAP